VDNLPKLVVILILCAYGVMLTFLCIAMVEFIVGIAPDLIGQAVERNEWGQNLALTRPCSVDCN